MMPVALIVRLCFWLWFGAAVATGHFLVWQRLPPFAAPLAGAILTAGLLLAYFRITAFRTWVGALDLRALVLLHLSRFVGIYFLVLYQRGLLPRDFAVPGGLGASVVATLALAVAFVPLQPESRLRAILIWNVVGSLDLLTTVWSGLRYTLGDPAQLRPLTQLPLSLLPTFILPLLVATHVVVFRRVLDRQRPT